MSAEQVVEFQNRDNSISSAKFVQDTENSHRAKILAQKLVGCSNADFESIADSILKYGFTITRTALVIKNQMRIPFSLCLQLADDPVRYIATKSHSSLVQLLQNLDESWRFQFGQYSAVARPTKVNSGIDLASINNPVLMGFSDLFSVCYPSEEDKLQHPELQSLQNMHSLESRADFLNGALGYLETSLPTCVDSNDHSSLKAGDVFYLVVNGQSRAPFYSLPSKMKNRYKCWYESLLSVHQIAAAKSGILTTGIPSNALVNQSLMAVFNHQAPPSALDAHYDKFAEKRGYEKCAISFVHPYSRIVLSGDVWLHTL